MHFPKNLFREGFLAGLSLSIMQIQEIEREG